MEFKIDRKSLLRGLTRTHGVADRKSSMPILSNVLMHAHEGSLHLSTTDLYLGVRTTAPVDISDEGMVAVSARTLFNIVKNLPDGPVHLKSDANHAVEIRCGKVNYRIPGMPGEDFPPLANPGDAEFIALEAALIGQLIGRTQYSMSNDDARPHLAGSLFERKGERLRTVTTDGHRLSKAEAVLEGEVGGVDFSILIPHKGISELRRIIDDAKSGESSTLEFGTAASNAFFRREGIMLVVKLADERFPPYDKVIPQKQTRKIVAERAMLAEALRRISLVANDKSGAVRLKLVEGQLDICSENPDVGEGSEEVSVDYAGEPLEIGFNAKYVLDVLNALNTDEVVLELSGELDPGVIRTPDEHGEFVGVIMPMRI